MLSRDAFAQLTPAVVTAGTRNGRAGLEQIQSCNDYSGTMGNVNRHVRKRAKGARLSIHLKPRTRVHVLHVLMARTKTTAIKNPSSLSLSLYIYIYIYEHTRI